MGKPNSHAGGIDELGVLITAALYLDRTWMEHGKCRKWRYPDDPDGNIHRPSPWHGSRVPIKVGDVTVKTSEMAKVALMVCHGCPAQWDCATYAVKGKLQAGIWSMPLPALKAMQDDEGSALELIERARAEGVSMQVAVTTVDVGS